MGLYISLFMTPEAGVHISQEAFQALTRALIEERLVRMPGAVLVGHLERVSSLFYLNDLAWGRTPDAAVQVVYIGKRRDRLLRALRTVADGARDVAVWFAGLNHQHPGLDPRGENPSWLQENSLEEVGLYALAQPRLVRTWDRVSNDTWNDYLTVEHETLMQDYLLVAGSYAPFTLYDTPVMAAAQHYFGPVQEYRDYL